MSRTENSQIYRIGHHRNPYHRLKKQRRMQWNRRQQVIEEHESNGSKELVAVFPGLWERNGVCPTQNKGAVARKPGLWEGISPKRLGLILLHLHFPSSKASTIVMFIRQLH